MQPFGALRFRIGILARAVQIMSALPLKNRRCNPGPAFRLLRAGIVARSDIVSHRLRWQVGVDGLRASVERCRTLSGPTERTIASNAPSCPRHFSVVALDRR